LGVEVWVGSALNPWNPPPKTGFGGPMAAVESGFVPAPNTTLLVPEKLLKPDIACPKFCAERVDVLVVDVVTDGKVDVVGAGFLSATNQVFRKKG
jgi:hypothetical protein